MGAFWCCAKSQLRDYNVLTCTWLEETYLEMAEFFVWSKWGGGGLFGSMSERGDPTLFQMLPPRFWTGRLVKWRTHLTYTAESVVRAGGNGVEMVECVIWGLYLGK
jgi:hypothetical protein